MIIGILGLGLIGGSFAKAYHEAGWQVLALDADPSTQEFAQLSGAVDGPLTDDKLASCDLILLAAYPAASIAYFKEKAHLMGPRPVVIDCCGTKRVVCSACFPAAKEHGVTFLGGHPMAGTHNSGFKYARANLLCRLWFPVSVRYGATCRLPARTPCRAAPRSLAGWCRTFCRRCSR